MINDICKEKSNIHEREKYNTTIRERIGCSLRVSSQRVDGMYRERGRFQKTNHKCVFQIFIL